MRLLIDRFPLILRGLLLFSIIFIHGCSLMISSAMEDLGRNLKRVMINHDDPQTVAEAIPTYLLLQEALLASDPENQSILITTANLYSSYISISLGQEVIRKQRLSEKAFEFALRGACLHKSELCSLNELVFDEFVSNLKQTDANDLEILYTVGANWANWIQAHQADWNAVAQLAQVKHLMNHIIALDESYKDGEVYLYLGVLESLVPPALGGKPEIAKANFEKALRLSSNKNLMVHVLYARYYARMMFDRKLHDGLLNTVINSEVKQQGYTLSNTMAQNQANKMLQSADDYF